MKQFAQIKQSVINGTTYLKRIGEDMRKSMRIFHEFREIFHKQLSFNGPVPWSVDSFQLITEMYHFSGHEINPLIESFEMIKGNLHHSSCIMHSFFAHIRTYIR